MVRFFSIYCIVTSFFSSFILFLIWNTNFSFFIFWLRSTNIFLFFFYFSRSFASVTCCFVYLLDSQSIIYLFIYLHFKINFALRELTVSSSTSSSSAPSSAHNKSHSFTLQLFWLDLQTKPLITTCVVAAYTVRFARRLLSLFGRPFLRLFLLRCDTWQPNRRQTIISRHVTPNILLPFFYRNRFQINVPNQKRKTICFFCWIFKKSL